MASSHLSLEEQIKLLRAEIEQEKALREQEKERREQAEAEIEQEVARREQAEAEIEQEVARREQAEARGAPLPFLEFLQCLEESVFSAFSYERNRTRAAPWRATDVTGKVYPHSLLPWTDFTDRHTASFNLLQASLGDQSLFRSRYVIEAMRQDIIRRGAIADEAEVSYIIDQAIEMPAVDIVTTYLSLAQEGTVRRIKFRGHAYGQMGRVSHSKSSSKGLMPDRWVYSNEGDDDASTIISVAEYKAPHLFKADMLERIMSAPSSDQFFAEAVRLPSSDESSPARPSPARMPGHLQVAQVLCQEYHFMINSGCEYGYIASGDSLVFLRVPEDAPGELYYHSVRLSVPENEDAEERRQQNAGARNASETAVAYITSLCLWASETTPRSLDWIRDAQNGAPRWPDRKQPPPSGSVEAAAAIEPKTPETPIVMRRSYIVEPPTLPYCTQACLGGLVRGLALDNNCPNVALHRAAHNSSSSNSTAATTASEANALAHEGHPLTLAMLQSQVLAQMAATFDKDLECLDKNGHFGRYGVLFKIAVTGYGYTFVGKSVVEKDMHILAHEADVYDSIPDLQGYLVPVFLGFIELARPLTRMCMDMTHFLLMSYAGLSLNFKKAWRNDVDLEAEAERTELQLEQAGIYNRDVRDNNLAWNEEVGRVMHFDFDQVSLYEESPEPDTLEVEPSMTTQPDELTLPAPRSPLLARTDWNASCAGHDTGTFNENGHTAKRIRVDTEVAEEEDVKHGLT